MTHSNLTSFCMHSPNGYFPRSDSIRKVTIHHMAGVMTAEQCGNVFASSARQASSNYGIGNDGEIACYVEEENAAWTSSSYWNDNQAITMEVSNSYAGDPWPISDAAWNSMIKLCADICKRYGITPSYTGGTDGTFTEHRMYAATGCPGEYIHSRMAQIVKEVKAAMGGNTDVREVQQWALGIDNPQQKWHLTKNSDGTYTIKAPNGGCLDVKGGSSTSGATVQVYKANGTNAQKWKLTRVAKSPSGIAYDPSTIAPFELSPMCAPSLRLDVKNASKSDGGSIQIYKSNNTNAQRWTVLDTGDGYVRILNCASGKALDLKL